MPLHTLHYVIAITSGYCHFCHWYWLGCSHWLRLFISYWYTLLPSLIMMSAFVIFHFHIIHIIHYCASFTLSFSRHWCFHIDYATILAIDATHIISLSSIVQTLGTDFGYACCHYYFLLITPFILGLPRFSWLLGHLLFIHYVSDYAITISFHITIIIAISDTDTPFQMLFSASIILLIEYYA